LINNTPKKAFSSIQLFAHFPLVSSIAIGTASGDSVQVTIILIAYASELFLPFPVVSANNRVSLSGKC